MESSVRCAESFDVNNCKCVKIILLYTMRKIEQYSIMCVCIELYSILEYRCITKGRSVRLHFYIALVLYMHFTRVI